MDPTGPITSDWLQAGAAILTMFAAFAALIIAWRAPVMAARFAESLRVANEAQSEREKMRLWVFAALMKCRRQILHADAITALNLVDVAFVDSADVRIAYRSFIDATLDQNHQPVAIVERYHALIDKIARDLGLGDKININDVRAGYYPNALGKLDEAAFADAEEKIARRQQSAGYGVVPPAPRG